MHGIYNSKVILNNLPRDHEHKICSGFMRFKKSECHNSQVSHWVLNSLYINICPVLLFHADSHPNVSYVGDMSSRHLHACTNLLQHSSGLAVFTCTGRESRLFNGMLCVTMDPLAQRGDRIILPPSTSTHLSLPSSLSHAHHLCLSPSTHLSRHCSPTPTTHT